MSAASGWGRLGVLFGLPAFAPQNAGGASSLTLLRAQVYSPACRLPSRTPPQASWHSLSVEEALEGLSSSASGLSSSEASARLAAYGPNQLTGAPPVSALKLLLDEFRSPLVLVLIGAAAVLVGVALIAEESDHYIDAGLIALIVVLNACLGFSQNYRASRGIEALNRLAAPSATVLRESRRIFRNIKKFVNYMLTGNLAEVLVILVATVFGYLPVTAVQILWINLVTDSGPAVALASDPAPQGAMREPPRHGAVLGRSMAALVGSVGVVMTIILIAAFFVGLRLWDLETARTMTFTGFVVQEYLRLLVIRVQEGMPICTNKWLWAAVSVSLLMQAVILYTPIGSAAFDTVPLGLEEWSILLAGLLVGFAVTTVTGKLVVRRFGPL